MNKTGPKLIILLLNLFCFISGNTQDSTRLDKAIALPGRFFTSLDSKTSTIGKKLDRQTDRYLSKLQKQEYKLKRKLFAKDSSLAKQVFGSMSQEYEQLRKENVISLQLAPVYSARLDTLKTALLFIENKQVLDEAALKNTLQQLKNVQDKLDASEAMRRYLLKRQQYLKEQFQKLGMVRQLKQFRKQVYYYQACINEYKELLADPNRMVAKVIETIVKIPAFKNFFASNSQIGSLFRVPSGGSNISNVSFTGLQTRNSVQQLISERSAGNSSQIIQTQLKTASEKASADKKTFTIPRLRKKSEELGFKPNSQKAKSFKSRLEKGANIHFGKPNKFFPKTADIALSLGYKLNDNGTLGLGTSYKLGLGNGFDNIQFSHRGYTFRSFIDWRIKGSIFLSGGYEKIFLPAPNDLNFPFKQWQESGLLGLSKKYAVNKSIRGNMQFLFDFLGYKAIPVRERFVFRLGYNF